MGTFGDVSSEAGCVSPGDGGGGGRGGGLPRGDQLGGTWSVFIPLVVGGRKEPQR